MPFAAELSAQTGGRHRAIKLLALAFRYPEVADGWIGHLPEYVALQQLLRAQFSPDEFEQLWQAGQSLDLQATAAELITTIA